MSADAGIAEAEGRVALARARLTGTLGELQERMRPQRLLKERVGRSARELRHACRRRDRDCEGAAGRGRGVAAGLAAFALRRPLKQLIRKIVTRKQKTEAPDDQL